ncbi:hypothetical protein AVEN_171005-1 [Araneus ventricosus]|uniref:Uncharacterized protein n=1 Tax=Araneus ventricosus TaxID=182803 RepID=A0A4Y2TE02_ARAVE|nr:hypothetical protein AVEN_242298-1 [Araneus ventricosus]GBN98767.1 hypothetical protein AVEN_171005-1 [Araneus ventricosus]
MQTPNGVKNPHRKKSIGVRSGERRGHSWKLPYPIICSPNSFTRRMSSRGGQLYSNLETSLASCTIMKGAHVERRARLHRPIRLGLGRAVLYPICGNIMTEKK